MKSFRPFQEFKNWLRALFRNEDPRSGLETEMEQHLEFIIEDFVSRGMTPSEARSAALRKFGNVESLKEECRDQWGTRVVANLIRDVRYSIRSLRKSKGYTAMLIFIFVFCIGPCALVFHVFNSLYLNPDRYPDEDRIVRIYDEFENFSQGGEKRRGTNAVLYRERKEQSEYIESIDIQFVDHRNVQVERGKAPESLDVFMVSPSLFDVLKVYPFLGRPFYDSDIGISSSEKVVIVTHSWWQSHLNADPEVVGNTLTIDGEPWVIVGVMPEGFSLPPFAGSWDVASIGVIIPIEIEERHLAAERRHRTSPAGCLARLKPGITKAMVETELAAINDRNAGNYPEFKEFQSNHPLHTYTMTVGEDHIRDLESTFFFAILMSVFVAAAGSLSIANFVIARNSYRIQEFATRASLGASRARLVGQLISETGVVAVIGAAIALLMTQLGLHGLSTFGMFSFFTITPSVNVTVETVVVTLLLSFAMAVICGAVSILPILRQGNLSSHLKEDSRSGTGSVSLKKYRGALVLTQSAIAFALLLNGGLLVRSFTEVLKIDPGYETDNLLYATIRVPDGRYSNAERYRKMLEFEKRIRALPEIEEAGLSNWPPMKHPNIYRNWVVRFDHRDQENPPIISSDVVSPTYFKALGITPLAGRLFEETDIANMNRVVVVDAAFAERVFPGEDPVGKRIALHFAGRLLRSDAEHWWMTIVGVVNSVRINDLYAPSSGMVYNHVGGRRLYWFGFVVKARSTTQNAIQSMQELLLEMEPDVSVGQPVPLKQAIARRYAERKNILFYCLGLVSIALGLAVLGISGVISYSIAAQKKEIGIRLALGARRGTVVVGSVLFWIKLALAGTLAGMLASILLSDQSKALLYGIEPLDLPTYGIATLVFVTAILAAAFHSARKVSFIQPVEALRDL